MHRVYFLLLMAPVASTPAIVGEGTIAYTCDTQSGLASTQLTSTGASGRLIAACDGSFLQGYTELGFSAAYGSLSVYSASYLWPWGGDSSGYSAFSDTISVIGKGAAFVVITGDAQVVGGSDQTSSLDWSLALGTGNLGAAYHSSRGSLSVTDLTDSVDYHFVDTLVSVGGRVTGIDRSYSYWVPITTDLPISLSGQINLKTGGSTIQVMKGTLTFTLSVVDEHFQPIDYRIVTGSGNQYAVPEPSSGSLILSIFTFLGASLSRAQNIRGKMFCRRSLTDRA